MEILHNQSLKNYNTFGIDAKAKNFVIAHTTDQLREILLENRGKEIFVLGGGSNMLLTKDIDALVIHIGIKGMEIVNEDDDHALVKSMSGENWHQFVLYTISQDLGGLENMSLIPGNVGTTPIQNIGAYGTEIKDTMVECEAMEIATGKVRKFAREECNFGYRESIFKNEEKGKYIILSVTFRLTKRNHKINTAYGDIQKHLADAGISEPGLKDVSDAVIAIRQSKLPDPRILGNSGSFFKNPIVPTEVYERAKAEYPEMPHYPVSDREVKVPAGWLIEKAGFKGLRFGDAGVHKNQALVLVNYGNATGAEILELSQKIQASVKEKFGIDIEAEVNVV